MTSAAERLAANINIGVLSKARELKQRMLFVMGALIVYRIGTYIPIPGIDPKILEQFFQQHAKGVLGVFNMFSGGALGRMTIFALAIMPYISASIIMQLMTGVLPYLAQLKKDGESGRKRINQFTRYFTVVLALFQGYGIAVGLENSSNGAVIDPGMLFRVTTAISLTAGTVFLMWLGEQITTRGIGNGTSLIIFAGIVAGLPSALASMFDLGRTGAMSTATILMVIVLALALIAMIVFVERAQRRIIIQYPKRQVGNKIYQGNQNHLPIKINSAGVIPPIFASAILLFPLTIANFNSGNGPEWLQNITLYLGHGRPLYILLYIVMIVFLSFVYTSVSFNPDETAENLKKNGGFIAGIRPGKNTSVYFDYVLTRLTVIGSAYLSLICVMPELLVSKLNVPFYLGGTGLLIVVNVTLDFVGQVQSHLFAHQYEGLIRKAKLRGGR